MLLTSEREALVAFIRCNLAEFARACDYCDVSRTGIIISIENRTTQSAYRKPKPLTERQVVAVKAFLRNLNKEFKSWCDIYEVSPDHIRNRLDKGGVRK